MKVVVWLTLAVELEGDDRDALYDEGLEIAESVTDDDPRVTLAKHQCIDQ